MPRPNPVKLSCFRRAHLPSTCSRVMPTAATNFARSSKPSRNEKEVQNAKAIPVQTQETWRHGYAPADSHRCDHHRLRRTRRTEHETVASAVDRSPASRGGSRRNHRVQRDQNTAGAENFLNRARHFPSKIRQDRSGPVCSRSQACRSTHESDGYVLSDLCRRERRQSSHDRKKVQSPI